MRTTTAFDVNHTSRRVLSALASVAVALTMIRFAFAHNPRRDAARPDGTVPA